MAGSSRCPCRRSETDARAAVVRSQGWRRFGMSGTSQAAGCDRFPGARSGSCALDEVGGAVAACVGGYDYLTRQVAALDPQRRATRAWRPTTPSAAKPPGYGLARKWPASRAWTAAQSLSLIHISEPT